MSFELPTTVNINGVIYDIRSDYRAILDICTALSDAELSQHEKILCALDIFYPDFINIPQEAYQEATNACFKFISCGEENDKKKSLRLVDWKKDFTYIVAPINRVLGKEVRSLDYLHWWTFMSAYMEIGDCLFAQIVRIRDRKARGKKLDKSDKEWYKENRSKVDLQNTYTDNENAALNLWLGK